jgi:hypothetical protein
MSPVTGLGDSIVPGYRHDAPTEPDMSLQKELDMTPVTGLGDSIVPGYRHFAPPTELDMTLQKEPDMSLLAELF